MAAEPIEITVKLQPADARRLRELASDKGSTVEAVAFRLLCEGLASGLPGGLEELFDATPGFYEEFMASVEQMKRGDTIPASELRGP